MCFSAACSLCVRAPPRISTSGHSTPSPTPHALAMHTHSTENTHKQGHAHTHISTSTHTRPHRHTHPHTHTLAHMHTHTHTRMTMHTHPHSRPPHRTMGLTVPEHTPTFLGGHPTRAIVRPHTISTDGNSLIKHSQSSNQSTAINSAGGEMLDPKVFPKRLGKACSSTTWFHADSKGNSVRNITWNIKGKRLRQAILFSF